MKPIRREWSRDNVDAQNRDVFEPQSPGEVAKEFAAYLLRR